MKDRGWVKLHRAIENNPLWLAEPFTKGQAWVDLFLNANHKDNEICIRGIFITIKRGQIGWSELTMSKRWKWSRNKVRRFLKHLKTIQQIEQQKDRYITTIVTITNYESYQSDTANDTANDTAERQQKDSKRYINKNDKNDKNDKKKKRSLLILKWFNQAMGTNYKATHGFEDNLEFWLKTYTERDIRDVLVKIRKGNWWAKSPSPTLLFRRKTPKGEAVDYIGDVLNERGGADND